MRNSFFPGAKPPIWVSRRHQPWYDVRFFTFEGVTSGGEGVTFLGPRVSQGVTASSVRIYTITVGYSSIGAGPWPCEAGSKSKPPPQGR